MSASTATSPASTEANGRQVGGQHYKTGGVEHWDLVHDAGVPYLLGCASKYVARHHKKDGRADLEKAVHYCEKYAEKEGPKTSQDCWQVSTLDLLHWAAVADLNSREVRILYYMLYIQDMEQTIELIRMRTQECYPVNEVKETCSLLDGGYKAGSPEDGGHHARQPPDDEEEIQRWGDEEILGDQLPQSLSRHEWQHQCSKSVQDLYEFDVSVSRYVIKPQCAAFTEHGRQD